MLLCPYAVFKGPSPRVRGAALRGTPFALLLLLIFASEGAKERRSVALQPAPEPQETSKSLAKLLTAPGAIDRLRASLLRASLG